MDRRSVVATAVVALSALACGPVHAQTKPAPNVLRMVPMSNLTILDPVWTTAYVTQAHAYMIYDTLFGTDEKGAIRPQMVDKWSASADQKAWTFTLRPGLEFHDGKPVTSEDVIASLQRWSSRDAMGGVMARFVEAYDAVDASTFRIRFKEPFGLTLEVLGKQAAPAFIMPKRVAATPGTEQIKEHVGSGPYAFVPEEFRPGAKVVYRKNARYQPRAEPPSGTAGGKKVYVDRVEWVIIRDPQTQLSALVAGEVDMIAGPTSEQYSSIRTTPHVNLVDMQPEGYQYSLRFNFMHPPFDNVMVRRAAMLALGQEQVLRTQVAAVGMFRYCKSLFPCGTPYESDRTGPFRGVANPDAARKLLDQAGYKGEPVVLLRPTDLPMLSKAPLVVKQQLEQAGFVVDMQSMDWQTLVARRARKDAPSQGGWNAFITAAVAADNANPITMAMMNAAGAKGWFGWHDDPELEKIKLDFVKARSDAERKKLAEAAQLRAIDQVTHVNLGQFNAPSAVRSNVKGMVPAGSAVYWNIRKD
jgi:peptide/nickel transport system substrate-binding protein